MMTSSASQFTLWGKQTRQLLLALIMATICYLLFKSVFVYPAFLFFNVLLSLQSTRRSTLAVSLQRILGSVLGSLLGLVIIYFVPTKYMLLLLPFALAFAAYLSYLAMNAFVPITLIIVLMMMTDNYDHDIYYYAFQRVLAACVGVTISLCTSYIYRAKTISYKQRFIKISRVLLEKFDVQFNEFMATNYISVRNQRKLVNEIQKLRIIHEKIAHEQVFFFKDNQVYLDIIQLFADYYMNLQIILKVKTENERLYAYHLAEINACKEKIIVKIEAFLK